MTQNRIPHQMIQMRRSRQRHQLRHLRRTRMTMTTNQHQNQRHRLVHRLDLLLAPRPIRMTIFRLKNGKINLRSTRKRKKMTTRTTSPDAKNENRLMTMMTTTKMTKMPKMLTKLEISPVRFVLKEKIMKNFLWSFFRSPQNAPRILKISGNFFCM